jgi:phage terminase large subunit
MTDTLTTPPINVTSTLLNVRVELRHRTSKTTVSAPHTLSKKEWPPNYEDVLVWRRAQLARYDVDPKFLANAKAFYSTHPVEFINHWCDTHDPRNVDTGRLVWMPFVLFEKQEQLVRFVLDCLDSEQPGLVEKSRTMGASWVCVAISVWLWLFKSGVAIGWGSQDAHSVDQIGNPKSIFWKLRELIHRLPPQFLPEGLTSGNLKQNVCSNPVNGSSIVGEVGDSIGRGGRTRIYFKDESAHYVHPEEVEAALSENTKVPIDISSVNGLGNLFHRKREGGLDWYPGVKLPRGRTRVFVMDWSDHPDYDTNWFKEKKKYHDDQATPHIFASEIERNYSASVQGTIIPKDWLDACVDAHIKLKIPVEGLRTAGLDIGDSEDGDRNALAVRTGIVLTFADEWTARDPGVTARKAMGICVDKKVDELQYDSAGGLGSNVKSEVNRLTQDEGFKLKLRVVPWNAGAKVLRPIERVVPEDAQSPRNKDFFTNLKAQAWWELRLRIYRTYQAIVGVADESGKLVKVEHDPDDLFSIDSRLPLLHKLTKELCQATASRGSKLKLLVDKSPEGTRSPNIADSIVMAYLPMPWNSGDFADIGMMPKIFVDGVSL